MWEYVLAFVFGVIIPFILAAILPNEKFYQIGFSLGKKLSAKGISWLGKETWEKLENSLLGSFIAFANGLEAGASDDDKDGSTI